MGISTYNSDKGYELMANIISSQLGPYDDTAREDITHILKLCYIYSADDDLTAADLGQAIIAYLSGGWGIPDFEQDAKEYWNPPSPAGEKETVSDPLSDPLSDTLPGFEVISE